MASGCAPAAASGFRVRHWFENTRTESAHLIVDADPALRLRESIEDGAALARAESFTARGRPAQPACVVGAAALAQRYRETVVLSSPPPALQRLLFPLLARFAHREPVAAHRS